MEGAAAFSFIYKYYLLPSAFAPIIIIKHTIYLYINRLTIFIPILATNVLNKC